MLLRPENLLTLARIPLAFVLWVWPADNRAFFALLALAAFTDMLDGAVARRRDPNVRRDPHNVGAWLDPLCDKIFVVSAVVVSVVIAAPPIPFVLLLVAREIVQGPLILLWALTWRRSGRVVDFRAVPAGKLTTVLQFWALVALRLAPQHFAWLAIASAVAGVFSVGLVVQRARVRQRSTGLAQPRA